MYRLEHQGLITSEWGQNENKRRRWTTRSHRRVASV
ncbi:MAG: hypothetical protein VX427_13730 [Acidobacteriota bacterium]|nr:hypothetical protein [Acidobacteriota bacterium]